MWMAQQVKAPSTKTGDPSSVPWIRTERDLIPVSCALTTYHIYITGMCAPLIINVLL